jgi:tRNA nucleotidyltransferase/poly(A) polymerase
MREYLLTRGATFYQERPQFVSIKAKLPDLGAVDFTLARKESFYTDARHPDKVSPAATIEEDLARRDFTMNAIAREVGTETLIDPFNGQEHIADARINSVGRALDRFNEDRLRMFRAVRFATQLGFNLSDEVGLAIDSFSDNEFDSVSAEMVQVELAKAFKANTARALLMLYEHPVLANVMLNKGVWLKPTLEPRE